MPIPNQFKRMDAFARTTTIAPFSPSLSLSLSLPLTLACSPSTLKKILWSLNVGSRVCAPKIQRLYISRWLNLYSPLYFKWKRRATYLHSISERHLFMLILIHFSPPLPLSSHQFAMPLRVYNCSIIIIIIKANINITKKNITHRLPHFRFIMFGVPTYKSTNRINENMEISFVNCFKKRISERRIHKSEKKVKPT